ncbi:MAG: aldehyde dehydrogenase family protein, partial [bacterium]
MLVAGEKKRTARALISKSPYDGRVIGEVFEADAALLESALERAVAGKAAVAALTAYQRYEILKRAADTLIARKADWSRLIALESGKTVREATLEVERAFQTLTLSAEEAKRIHGETVPFDAAPRGEGKTGFYLRVPVGVVLAITPFNFPLNLACHKVGPAIAAGNAVILKPSSYTPLTGLKLGELLLESGLPAEGISVLIGPGETVGERLAADPRIRVISFTGSPE